jgi:hypothetical protein
VVEDADGYRWLNGNEGIIRLESSPAWASPQLERARRRVEEHTREAWRAGVR